MEDAEDAEDTRVCYDCIGDRFLSEEVRSQGARAKCTYCRTTRESVSLKELADRIDGVIESDFSLTPTEPQDGYELAMAKEDGWVRPGLPVNDLIQDIAGVNEAIATDVQEHLSDRSDYDAKEGEEDPYGDEACYAEKGADEWDLRETWDFVRREVRFRSRFFSSHAQEALNEIFGDIKTLCTSEGAPAIREIKPSDEDRYLYRARVAFSDSDLKDILGDPVKGLGPPPSRNARAGRMNAAGISVFYGARDEETCIAEARAPVGSYVVTGRFEIIRPVRLLDFDVLNQVYVQGSHFDPKFHTRRGRAAFLERLVREVSRPVMPRDEEFEYLPTQAVSEYLASCVEPRLDGIVFHSSQTADEGRNVVLFNRARRVEPYDLPKGTKLEFMMGSKTEDDHDDSIAIFEEVPPEKPQPSSLGQFVRVNLDIFVLDREGGDDDIEYRDMTLRLDVGGIRVLKILAVSYKYEKRIVSRSRKTKGKHEDRRLSDPAGLYTREARAGLESEVADADPPA
jgi:RES domain/HEPN/RES N-terminal domain 1